MMNSILTVKNLTICYDRNTVIRGANFEVEKGDFMCVVGANGSGKSTLIKTVLGLVKAKSGEIIRNEKLMSGGIGYLPQEMIIEQNFPATVLEIVLSGMLGRMKGKLFYGQDEKNNADKVLNSLNIGKLKEKSFSELSGGQKQKVLLARALVANPDLLILDEPSNNLDHKSRGKFYETLKSLNGNGMTIIMITHDIDADDLIGNKVLAINGGEVKCSTTKDYLRSYR